MLSILAPEAIADGKPAPSPPPKGSTGPRPFPSHDASVTSPIRGLCRKLATSGHTDQFFYSRFTEGKTKHYHYII